MKRGQIYFANGFDIRAGIIVDQAALRAVQTYIRDVCKRPWEARFSLCLFAASSF